MTIGSLIARAASRLPWMKRRANKLSQAEAVRQVLRPIRPALMLRRATQFAGGKSPTGALHCGGGAAECVRGLILGALSILKGAVPGRARGLGHMAPTYMCREPGIVAPTARAGPRFLFDGSQRHLQH